MTDRSVALQTGNLTATLTGGALALVGTTLYWGRVTDTVQTLYFVRLDDLNRLVAPMATLWVVLVVGGALMGRGSTRWAVVIRRATALFATVGACTMLAVTVFLSEGGNVVVHAALSDTASVVRAERVVPDTGCMLYVVGLALVAAGAWLLEATAHPLPAPPPAGRPALHRVVVTLAVILAVVSTVLPWYRSIPADAVRAIGAAPQTGYQDAQTWLAIYRVGLAVCLVITVLALVLRRHGPRLRLLGLIVGVAVTVMLLSGYATLWRPALQYATDRIGPGYHLGVVAMLLLTASFLALPAGEVSHES
jgi:hypothetical protein